MRTLQPWEEALIINNIGIIIITKKIKALVALKEHKLAKDLMVLEEQNMAKGLGTALGVRRRDNGAHILK